MGNKIEIIPEKEKRSATIFLYNGNRLIIKWKIALWKKMARPGPAAISFQGSGDPG